MSRAVTVVEGLAVPLIEDNLDTDQIVPGQFLRTVTRTGLGRGLFYDRRHDADGHSVAGFVLDEQRYRNAAILVAGDNFGCGSSREHAAWALLDAGIVCVVAPSFGDIFYNNALNNALLPVRLPRDAVERCAIAAEAGVPMRVSLVDQRVTVGNAQFAFDISPQARGDLLRGTDPIGRTLEHLASIEAIEATLDRRLPWRHPHGRS